MKEISLSLTIRITLRQTDVHWLEGQLLAERTRLFAEALHRVVAEIEASVLEHATCPTCGGPLVGNGRVPLVLETLLGRLEYARQRCRCLRCAGDVYPLDTALGLLPGTGSTLGVRERALWAVTEVSYAKAAAFLAKFTGLEVSHGRIHAWVREEGQHLEVQEAMQQTATFGPRPTPVLAPGLGPPRLYVQVDGTLVRERDAGHMECKVGIVYSERAMISRHRIALLDKQTYASFDDATTFGERFWVACAGPAGAATAGQVVFVSDGAAWIHTLQQAYFPGALVILDPWHLEQRLWEAWGVGRPRLVASCLAAAWRGDVPGLQQRLRAARARVADPDQRARVDELLGYIATNTEGIRNLARLEATGSGAVEKTVDVVVTHRYKKRGMSWRRPGSQALLKLRLLRLNGTWDTYWAARRVAVAQLAA
jgi:uncharacterized protein UPF0236